MSKLTQTGFFLNEIDATVLIIGVTVLLLILLMGYRERRVRKMKLREDTTRLMVGEFDLYNQEDRVKLDDLVDDLFGMYLMSHLECGIEIEPTHEVFDEFIKTFAHPYIAGRLDLTSLRQDVAVEYNRMHQQYLDNKTKPA